ncbi:tRNA (adenosine(37)-N6)-threonylcarbamoyltransferase complex ATPase subunit type 1 TsaE [Desulfocurvibacter africanus]|uniref:tRNA threonylcarbamoyladenosine biosynthesis protein TsaE n=1 Tax=Desulfocurvibacter africanus subsp. africanus str. Walvis Bay TaxID=690850 RepID=F3Z0V7_DESAF|nr:tRNA (adenosine(37)-N6)-threonylcarbamoyltransferase complex ATPase subunit type 1 TsaE [Desulfocurvibacter africanus]EGJ51035.1 Uncharacterized protein family UPF0079, ATPase [Desulfocurvibacter africanus subsp. africanus str. Walvis Bay]
MLLRLADAEETLEFGRILAKGLPAEPGFAILLEGDLGAGKTTLVRGLVSALPGSEQAEVSSPSFTICNLYPTRPQVAHFDLYRQQGSAPDDQYCESLESPFTLVVVEWAQYLAPADMPEDVLRLTWQPAEAGRLVKLEARGQATERYLHGIYGKLRRFAAS